MPYRVPLLWQSQAPGPERRVRPARIGCLAVHRRVPPQTRRPRLLAERERRLSIDDKLLAETRDSSLQVTMIHLMIGRLARIASS